MSVTIPKTQDLVTRNVTTFESKLSQSVPAADKSFLRVLSVALAAIETEVIRKLIFESKQNIGLTASGSGLDELYFGKIGARNPAEACVLTGTISADTAATLPATISFVGDSNGVLYFPDSSYTESGGVITATVTADELGLTGNLEVGDTLSISSKISGVGSVLTVTSVDNLGVEQESDEDYRQRGLDSERLITGGGNSADYRIWAEAVNGVTRAYPYAGLPYPDDPLDAVPPDRVVYVEANTDIDPDGIAPSTLIDEVRDAINNDPVTGIDNEPLGLVDESLYVESIRRTTLYFEVRGLNVPAADESSIQSQIESALSSYSRSLRPYVEGLDFVGDKNDTITDLTVSDLVQGILTSVGGDAEGVTFGLSVGVNIPRYTLGEGEMAKSGGVTYVA